MLTYIKLSIYLLHPTSGTTSQSVCMISSPFFFLVLTFYTWLSHFARQAFAWPASRLSWVAAGAKSREMSQRVKWVGGGPSSRFVHRLLLRSFTDGFAGATMQRWERARRLAFAISKWLCSLYLQVFSLESIFFLDGNLKRNRIKIAVVPVFLVFMTGQLGLILIHGL